MDRREGDARHVALHSLLLHRTHRVLRRACGLALRGSWPCRFPWWGRSEVHPPRITVHLPRREARHLRGKRVITSERCICLAERRTIMRGGSTSLARECAVMSRKRASLRGKWIFLRGERALLRGNRVSLREKCISSAREAHALARRMRFSRWKVRLAGCGGSPVPRGGRPMNGRSWSPCEPVAVHAEWPTAVEGDLD